MKNIYRIVITLGILIQFFGILTVRAETPAPALDRIPLANTLNTDFSILDYVLVEKQRVGRSDYSYTYRANLKNNGPAIKNSSAKLIGTSSNTVVVDGTLNFGNVDDGAVVTSTDTFTIRQNRLYPFDPQSLSWTLEFEACSSPTMSVPEFPAPLLSGISANMAIPFCYSGPQVLAFHLVEGPSGMTIDSASGVIAWEPPASMEGQDALVKVSVTDGITVSHLEFNIPVALSTPVATSVSNNTVTVIESGDLQGLSITLPVNTYPIDQVEFSKIDETEVAKIPDGVIRLTDIFRTTSIKSDNNIIISYPSGNLPAGRYPFELTLYTYTSVDANSGGNYSTWVPSQLGLNINQNGQVTIDTNRIGEASFLGISAEIITGISSPVVSEEAFDGTTVNCTPKKWLIPNTLIPPIPLFNEIIDGNHQICTIAGDNNYKSDIYNFNDNKWIGNVTVNKLAYWAYQAQGLFDDLNVSYDDKITIRVEQLDRPDDPYWAYVAGYVSSGDNRKTIHLDSDQRSEDSMNTTTLHEYFHQAQSRTTSQGLTNILSAVQTRSFAWIYEGTARWFEDYDISDNLNTYLWMSPLTNILKNGINQYHDGTSEYERFAFFKMLESRCNGFNIGDIVNVNISNDPTGVKNLSSHLSSPQWECSFGNGFGVVNKNTLAAALLYYQFSTLKKDDIELLDNNEDKTKFRFDNVIQTLNPSNYSNSLQVGVPKNGARSYKVLPVAAVPSGKEVFIRIAATGDGAWVSFVENDLDNSAWIDTSNQTEFVYGQNGSAPELFVTVVNPSAENTTNVSITTGIRDISMGSLTITSPVAGQNYNNRVIDVVGTIPSTFSSSVAKVLIEQPNISGSMNIANVSGNTFKGKAVIRLGQNTITVVGLDANNNRITAPKTVSFTGVEHPTQGAANALIKSNMVFVLQWDTNNSDLDMYVTDPLNRTIWYGQRSISGVGIQDVDDTNGYGPEVTSFFTNGNAVDGNYEVNINAYAIGAGSTHYTIDVLLNEGSNAPVLGYFYSSYPNAPLSSSSFGAGFPPGSSNSAWGADVIKVNCAGSDVDMRCALD